MINCRAIIIYCFLCIGVVVSGQSDIIDQLTTSSVFDHSTIGVSLRDVSTGKEVQALNSQKLMSPASSLKLITSLTAISVLGEDFRFKTKVGHTGYIGGDGTLYGDIVIIGGGDPSFGGPKSRSALTYKEVLADIVKEVKAAGITCVEGDVIADSKIFSGQSIPDEWNYNDVGNYFASGAWGLNFNENLYWITFGKNKKGKKAYIVDVAPRISTMSWQSEVMTAGPKSGDNAYIYGGPQTDHKVITGTIPQSDTTFVIKGALSYPPLQTAELILTALEKKKIKISGHVTHERHTKKLKEIKTYKSAPLADMVTEANRHSINIYCDAMLRMLGAHKRNDGSIQWGKKAIKNYAKSLGLDTEQLIQKDGSGLARENVITPSFMTNFLTEQQKIHGSKVLSWIPRAGREGTVVSILRSGPGAGNFYLKSGSFSGVQSYSGYMKGKSGNSYAVSIMVNNYTCGYSTMRGHLEKIFQGLYKAY